jgi:hypothetical protein
VTAIEFYGSSDSVIKSIVLSDGDKHFYSEIFC